jgi:HK97 gp10 family phage protein
MELFKKNNSIELVGAKAIQEMFRKLPKQVNQDKIWDKFFKKNSKPLVDKAQSLAPKKTGQLAKSIGYFRTKASQKFLGGYVGPRVRTGKWAKRNKDYKGSNKSKIYINSGFYGAWQEYGSEVMFGGKGVGKSQPFMKPAFEQTKVQMMNNAFRDAEIIFAKAIKSHEKRLQKFGKFGY